MRRLFCNALSIGLILFLAQSYRSEPLKSHFQSNKPDKTSETKSSGKNIQLNKDTSSSLQENSEKSALVLAEIKGNSNREEQDRNRLKAVSTIKELLNSEKSVQRRTRAQDQPRNRTQDSTSQENPITNVKFNHRRFARSKAVRNTTESKNSVAQPGSPAEEKSQKSKKQQIASFLVPRNQKLNLQHHPILRHTHFMNPIHKYMSPNGMEHRYVGTPIHRYLSKPINLAAFTGNGLEMNHRPVKNFGDLPAFAMEGKPLEDVLQREKPLEYIAGHQGIAPLEPKKGNEVQEAQNSEAEGEKMMAPQNDMLASPQSNALEDQPPIELNKQFDDIGQYQENRFGAPIAQGFHGPELLPMPLLPVPNNLVPIGAPVMNHFVPPGVPISMMKPGLPLMNHPMSFRRPPMSGMFPGPPQRLVLVDHHHLGKVAFNPSKMDNLLRRHKRSSFNKMCISLIKMEKNAERPCL